MYDFQTNQTYSFQTYAPAILGNDFNNLMIKGTLDADTAGILGLDIQAYHRNIFPFVHAADPTIVDDPTQYTYLRIQSPAGEISIIAAEWINPSTIVGVANQTLYLSVPNTLPSEVPNIVAAIVGLGKSNVTSELK